MSTVFVTIETTPFSGATLLSTLLGAHPSIATVAEMSGLIDGVDPDVYLCSCGQKIKDCGFWKLVAKGMLDRGHGFTVSHFDMQFISSGEASLLSRLREGSARNKYFDSIRDSILFALPAQARYFRAMSDRNEAFIATVLDITGKKTFVDSSKDRLRPKALRRYSSLDVRIIHLVRDVRGVVASQLRRDKRVTVGQAVRAWYRRHRRVEITLESWPKNKHILVRYEDLCKNPESTLRQLYGFCDAETDCRIEDYQSISHHLVGNPMRLTQLSKIELDERWKEELTVNQLKVIGSVAGNMAQKYGYDVNGVN